MQATCICNISVTTTSTEFRPFVQSGRERLAGCGAFHPRKFFSLKRRFSAPLARRGFQPRCLRSPRRLTFAPPSPSNILSVPFPEQHHLQASNDDGPNDEGDSTPASICSPQIPRPKRSKIAHKRGTKRPLRWHQSIQGQALRASTNSEPVEEKEPFRPGRGGTSLVAPNTTLNKQKGTSESRPCLFCYSLVRFNLRRSQSRAPRRGAPQDLAD